MTRRTKNDRAAGTLPSHMVPPLRVAIVAHSHPSYSLGGGEIAAFRLFRALQDCADIDTWFLGCDRSGAADHLGAVITQPFSDAEFIYRTGPFDWFKFANTDLQFPQEIETLFADRAPDVVHFHHYINFGVEVFAHLRRVRPACRIIVTLHEYLAICHNSGQMSTTDHRLPCRRSSPERCRACFPQYETTDFFLRKLYIQRYFDLVDLFIAPSRFLAERYVEWGIPDEKVVVLENLLPPIPVTNPLPPQATGPLRFGYFGQISTLKGIDVLLDAAALLQSQGITDIVFDIHGDYRAQTDEARARFLARLDKAGPNIRFRGRYDPDDVDRLMQGVHAVVVPSIWWENSPVVIQEAMRNKRPVICSNIGGMAEKVRDGIDGFHFEAGDAMALADLLRGFSKDRSRLARQAERMQRQRATSVSVDDFLSLYRGSC